MYRPLSLGGKEGSVHRLLEQISTKILCKNICLAASLSMKHSLLSLRFVPRFPTLTSEIRCKQKYYKGLSGDLSDCYLGVKNSKAYLLYSKKSYHRGLLDCCLIFPRGIACESIQFFEDAYILSQDSTIFHFPAIFTSCKSHDH